MQSEDYRAVMRHQAGAVAVIATGTPGARAGLTATAVCSLSDQPPMLLACVNRNASAHGPILENGVFTVNLLAEDQDDVAGVFAGQTGLKGDARFDDARWLTLATGAPVLKGAIASLDCRLHETVSAATHTVIIGAVADGCFRSDSQPLLYFRGDFWQLPAEDASTA